MSSMERNKGIIREIYPGMSIELAVDKLIADGKIEADDVEKYDGKIGYIDSEDYEIVHDRLFDVSGAPGIVDDGDEGIEEVERLNDTDYKIHLYYYNGGGNMSEILDDAIPTADAEYEKKAKSPVFYAIKRSNGHLMTRDNSSAPALYMTEQKARSTVERNWRGVVSDGYTIVKFQEV